MVDTSAWEEVYEIVHLIPTGRVMSYGQIAGLCTRPLTPRAVGWAMHDCPPDVPWHRVVNAAGGCSADAVTGTDRQRRRLQKEGIEFSGNGKVDMSQYRFEVDLDDIVEMLAEVEA